MKYAAVALLLIASQANATGASFSYEGRAFDASGNPLTEASVQFKLQVRSPLPSDCLLYEETQMQNLSGSNGFFTLPLNDTGSAGTLGSGVADFNHVFLEFFEWCRLRVYERFLYGIARRQAHARRFGGKCCVKWCLRSASCDCDRRSSNSNRSAAACGLTDS